MPPKNRPGWDLNEHQYRDLRGPPGHRPRGYRGAPLRHLLPAPPSSRPADGLHQLQRGALPRGDRAGPRPVRSGTRGRDRPVRRGFADPAAQRGALLYRGRLLLQRARARAHQRLRSGQPAHYRSAERHPARHGLRRGPGGPGLTTYGESSWSWTRSTTTRRSCEPSSSGAWAPTSSRSPCARSTSCARRPSSRRDTPRESRTGGGASRSPCTRTNRPPGARSVQTSERNSYPPRLLRCKARANRSCKRDQGSSQQGGRTATRRPS